MHLTPSTLLQSLLRDTSCPNHGAATQDEGEGGSADDGGDGNGHEPAGLEGRVAADCEAEESADHEAHDCSLNHIFLCALCLSLESGPLLGHFAGTVEGHQVSAELLLPEGPFVRVVGQTDVRGQAGID